ncbi:hypothetical protein WB67_00970 [bacteria symbiont BFo2 of Frankliniella occidentalis]|nr:hypothetical protein WB60_09030 [bacteria symbiont BFo2 of Frankliniella occidentalis]KYP96827.1 hypothetical protein WB67_00970 [bacteria symbiont BFo2 of Frankliniella occidentalis]
MVDNCWQASNRGLCIIFQKDDKPIKKNFFNDGTFLLREFRCKLLSEILTEQGKSILVEINNCHFMIRYAPLKFILFVY